MIHFYDSASPENIPSGSYAAPYITGFAWRSADFNRMSRVFRIATMGDPTYWARHGRCSDVERGAYTWEDAVKFCIARHEHGWHDYTCYANLSTMQDFDGQGHSVVAVFKEHAPGRPFRLWVADWDNNPGNRPEVDGKRAWAKQYQNVGDRYDLSVLYGTNDFVRP